MSSSAEACSPCSLSLASGIWNWPITTRLVEVVWDKWDPKAGVASELGMETIGTIGCTKSGAATGARQASPLEPPRPHGWCHAGMGPCGRLPAGLSMAVATVSSIPGGAPAAHTTVPAPALSSCMPPPESGAVDEAGGRGNVLLDEAPRGVAASHHCCRGSSTCRPRRSM